LATHYSKTYRDLRAIEPTDYRGIIRMYEEREQEIGRLDVVEHFEITVLYVDALFETGAYREHQLMVDLVIHASIQHDIRYVPGREEEIYEYQLFRKAASAYRTGEFATTEHVLRELLRMRPGRDTYYRFLRTTLFRRQSGTIQYGRAVCILCMLLTAAVVTVNLLVIQTFFTELAPLFNTVSATLFSVGILALLSVYAYCYYLASREATHFRAVQANKKRSKPLL